MKNEDVDLLTDNQSSPSPPAERRSTYNLVYPTLVTAAALHQVGLVDTSPCIYVLKSTSLAKLNAFQQLVTDMEKIRWYSHHLPANQIALTKSLCIPGVTILAYLA